MSQRISVEVLLDITLSQKEIPFMGPAQPGAPAPPGRTQQFKICHPVTIIANGDLDRLQWVQHPDRTGGFEYRLPNPSGKNKGTVTFKDGDCELREPENGKVAVTLSDFTAPVSSTSGRADYKWETKAYGSNANITWTGRGVWKLVADRSDPPDQNFVLSNWKFDTSASTSLGILVAEGAKGTLVFKDPYRRTKRFAYVGGGPSADLGKALKLVKALKDAKWIQKLIVGLDKTAGKGGVSGSTEDMFSTGAVFKNLTLGERELTPEDFCGSCLWLDGSIGIYKSIGGMLMLTNVSTFGPFTTFSAIIPCVGVNTTILSAGVGVCMGTVAPA